MIKNKYVLYIYIYIYINIYIQSMENIVLQPKVS